MAAVDLNSIRKSYGPMVVAGGVGLAIRHQALTGLLNPSGCGKTTTLRGQAVHLQVQSSTEPLKKVAASDRPPSC